MLDLLELNLWSPEYDKAWREGYGKYEHPARRLFKTFPMNSLKYKLTSFSELDRYKKTGKAESSRKDVVKKLYDVTIEAEKYTNSIEIPYEDRDDDKYAIIRGYEQANMFGQIYADTEEKVCTALIADAFAGATYLAQDSVAICGNHTLKVDGGTVSNKITTKFSRDALDEMEQKIIDNARNSIGNVIPLLSRAKTVFYHPKLEDKVWKVINPKAKEMPDTADRNANRFAGKYNPVALPLLEEISGTDNYWGLHIPDLGLAFGQREAHKYKAYINDDIDTYVFKGRGRFVVACYDYRALWMSDGSA